MKDFVSINEREFISVKRASEITKYSKDYVGQLCREGKIAARMIGRTWFIDQESILNYKKTSDVFFVNYGKQRDVSQQVISTTPAEAVVEPARISRVPVEKSVYTARTSDVATYSTDDRPLLPVLDKVAPSFRQNEIITAVARTRARARSVSWPESKFFRSIVVVVLLMAVISGSAALFMGHSLSRTNLIATQTENTASIASMVETITEVFRNMLGIKSRIVATDIDKPPPDYAGVAVVPSTDSRVSDELVKRKIQQSFSDEVEVRPDESGTSGTITPIFKEAKGDNFMYVLVPVQEQEQGP